MENSRKDSLPEFDSEYIDQLFSSEKTPVAQDPPVAPTPAEPEPEQEPATTAQTVKRPNPLLLLAAAGLLILGFLIGSLFGREKTPATATTPPATTPPAATLPPQFGFIPSYETWSTDSLALMATELPILWDAPVTQENFAALSRQFPVLKVLADRNDALDALQKIGKTGKAAEAARWLTDYITAYVPYIPPCRWLQLDDIHFEVYEFTAAPTVAVVLPTTANGSTKTLLQFDGDFFVVDGEPEILKEECNFWFLLEKKEGSNAKLDTEYFQIYNDTNVPDARIDFLPCEEGWIVCGYAPVNVNIDLQYNTLGTNHLWLMPSQPLPDGLSTEELLRETLKLPTFQRYLCGTKPANFQYHPLMAALLERDDLISTALQMAKNSAQGYYDILMVLLAHESVYAQMTETQKNAFEMLEAKRYWSGSRFYGSRPALAITGEYAVCDTYYLSASDAKTIRDTEADHWFLFGLSSGAIELNDGSWTLEIEEQGSSTLVPGTEKANILLWPAYHSRGDYAQVGWLIAVQGETPYLLRLTIRDGRGNILDAAEVTWVELSILPES